MAPLPPKQSGIFKKILKCYDYKQYKMGLKLTKLILSNPETANHGETLAMKGLILNCMGKKEEAYEYVRKGLRNDLTSHVCWHVYGLLQRSEHKYDEAIKCYRNALKYDKDNITILRDLSLLQIQMRDLEGFRDTRYQLFMLRSAQRVSWLSFAAAYHLLNDYATAAKILDEFRVTQKQQKEQNSNFAPEDNDSTVKPSHPEPIDYEQSELLLYQVMILYEAKSYKEALDFLNKHSSQICDRLALLEFKAQLLLALGRNVEAAKLLQEQLIARNQENYLYYQQLEQALNLDPQDEVNKLVLYQNIQQKYPRSQVPFKIPLDFVKSAKNFRPLVDAYLRKSIRKCQPSLFRNLRPVYSFEYERMVANLNREYLDRRKQLLESKIHSNQEGEKESQYIELSNKSCEARKTRALVFRNHGIPEKIKIIEDLVLSYDKNLSDNISFDSDPDTKNSENKTSILWVYYFLAQHYDYLGQYEKALEYVRIAIEHTPTLIELLTLKGKIYKHMGEFEKAAEQVNEAQRLDTADRYLNSKCAKYFLRANKVAQADEMCSKFTRSGVSVTENLNEMQCMWYQIETARAYLRMKKYGMALRKCYEIDAFFSEVTEDQFDFHTYCMRKMTLRSYVKLLRMEDVLRSHRFYFDAADIAIEIYLKLHDEPLIDGKENQNNQDNNQLSASELRKIKSKERKAAAKQQQKQGNNKLQNHDGDNERTGGKTGQKGNKNEVSQSGNKQSQTSDAYDDQNEAMRLDPKLLEHPKDPLENAIRFLRPLKTLATERVDTHLLAFEVYKRKNKLLLMLQSVKRALRLDPHHSKLAKQLAQFMAIVDSLTKSEKLSGTIRRVLEIELPKLKIEEH